MAWKLPLRLEERPRLRHTQLYFQSITSRQVYEKLLSDRIGTALGREQFRPNL
jgi:hypothetical protein